MLKVDVLQNSRRCKRNTKNEDGDEYEDGDLKEIDPLIDRFLKSQLKIETPKGERKEMSAASFFDSDEWKNTNRILFVGDLLAGETPIIKQANSMCSQEDFDETLFIVDIKKLNFKADFVNEIHKQLPPNSKYSPDDVYEMLSFEKCLLIFDIGGEQLDLPKPPDSEKDTIADRFTICDILFKNINDCLRVWITSKPSISSYHFKNYTKIYLQKIKEHGSQRSITNI
ncbi:hypothetical protein BSL78_23669 [Apostichopus japonicus]|uniref:Uncharacterized protein n=1 Tax=Stichopus japonicus TaxID=307972 RepID=A0A2G8JUX0_STIJA|nr:hypothetical protein BSL78_23669 [Apostichopus japonicus]